MTALPSHLDLVYHAREPYPRAVPLDAVYADLELPAGRPGRPFVYLNMVQTLDGQTVVGGSAWTIGTEVDHHLFRQLRVHADAVLSGAGTLRRDDVVVTTHPELQERRRRAGQPPNPPAVLLSATCRFAPEVFGKEFFRRTDFDRLILTTPRAAPADIAQVRARGVPVEIVPAGPDGGVDLEEALRHLAGRGVRRLLCEGGPTLAAALARAALLDEVFLTVTLRIGGDPSQPRLFAGPVRAGPLDVVSLYHYREGGLREVYLRFRLTSP
ncbi:MAG: dihydrofolate reductase family protein [Armatimonadota bacterium]|nr:dihydrofolate reductase family protein [Armatimonadota bacterium]MDR7403957.1 dihydrofolate reductase family protein [Armatimonadota bacterium]MDR7613096.1 dihydrofolate reductase family protein [Armatimonadota bacterium]